MSGRSYAEMMARPAALRRPLSYTPSSAAGTNAQPTVSPRRRRQLAPPPRAATSTSAIAESPRRLLSYYLSKAAYNTEADEELAEEGAANVQGVADTVALRDTSDAGDEAYQDASVAQEASALERRTLQAPSPATSSLSLRPPPFRSAGAALSSSATSPLPAPAAFSTSLRAHTAYAESDKITGQKVLEERSLRNSALMTPPWQDTATRATSSVPAPPPPLPRAESPPTSPTPTGAPSSSLSHLAVYTDEQRRVFEAEVMRQVEALLVAQCSESHAELEAYRVAAEEAQATLRTIETALEEQLGGAQHVRAAQHGSSADVSTPHPTAPPGVDTLALDMSRVAAEAAEPAAAQLLDGIMHIHDGEDVPAVLRRTVQRLFLDLTRALVPPVMTFVEQHGHCERAADSATATPGHATDGREAFADAAAEALRRAQAEAAALQEEVNALRRTLRGGAAQLQLPSSPASTASAVIAAASTSSRPAPHPSRCLHPSQVELIESLQDRLFAECHATLTRSRSEALALRHALEEERRQHFLTRLRLLKAPSAATAAPPARTTAADAPLTSASPPPRDVSTAFGVRSSAPSEPPRTLRAAPSVVVATDIDGRDREASAGRRSISGSGSSPRMRDSSATQSPPSPSLEMHDEDTHTPAAATKRAPPPPSALPHTQRQWSPAAASPLAFASGSRRGAVDEDEPFGEEAEKANARHTLPLRMAAHQRQRPAPSHSSSTAAPSTTRSLETAMRVAEEVLRTTAAPAEPATHPYLRDGAGDARTRWRDDSSGINGDWDRAAMPRSHVAERSVSFVDADDGTLLERDGVVRRPALQRTAAASASTSIRVLGSSSSGGGMTDAGGLGGSRVGAGASAGLGSSVEALWGDRGGSSTTTPAGGFPGLHPGDYEKRVWDKTVELLSRYAVT